MRAGLEPGYSTQYTFVHGCLKLAFFSSQPEKVPPSRTGKPNDALHTPKSSQSSMRASSPSAHTDVESVITPDPTSSTTSSYESASLGESSGGMA